MKRAGLHRQTPSGSLKRLLGRGLLALALLFGQQAATLHWLSHAIEATQAKATQTPPADHCDECLTLAGLGSGATSAPLTFATGGGQHVLVAVRQPADAQPAPRHRVRSRAPPILG